MIRDVPARVDVDGGDVEEASLSKIASVSYWKSILTPDAPPSNPATSDDHKALGPLSGVAASVDNCACSSLSPQLTLCARSNLLSPPLFIQTSASRTAAPPS